MNEATLRKREQLETFIARHVAPHHAVRAVAVYGSVASGHARPDSDVDAYVFMDPLDTSLLPAEAIWRPADDSFRSIFSSEPPHPEDLQLDLARVPSRRWSDPGFAWPVAARAALQHPWIAFDRDDVADVITAHVQMSREERRVLLDRALLDADGLLDDAEQAWERHSPAEALDRLNAMWEALLAATYAVNHAWLPYRGRGLRGLDRLAWRCVDDDELMTAVATDGHDRNAALRRTRVLSAAHDRLLAVLHDDPDYGDDPTFAAFLRAHDEPGRAWNLDEWNRSRPPSIRRAEP